MADEVTAGSRRLAFQRAPEAVSPRGMFDQVTPAGGRRFLMVAVSAFSGRGYHATTTRDIATLAGSSPAGIYTYFATKADLLYEIAAICHASIFDVMTQAVGSSNEPVERVARMVRASVMWHAEEHIVASVVSADFRALDVARLAKIMKVRRAISGIVRDEVERGVEAGVFHVEHLAGTVIAMLRLMDVAAWYNERGSMTPEELADLYADLTLRMLGTSDELRLGHSTILGDPDASS